MTERQREFVTGRGTKDEERTRANGVESLDRGILRLKGKAGSFAVGKTGSVGGK